MQNFFPGDYIKQKRMDLGLTQEQLCEGICEPMTLSRLENGKQTPSRNRINALLQRMGLPDDRYFALLSKNELEMEALQKEIVACNVTERVDEGFEKLAQFEQLADPDDQIAKQFALRSREVLGCLAKQYTPQERIDLLMQAIRLTIPRFDVAISRHSITQLYLRLIRLFRVGHTGQRHGQDLRLCGKAGGGQQAARQHRRGQKCKDTLLWLPPNKKPLPAD